MPPKKIDMKLAQEAADSMAGRLAKAVGKTAAPSMIPEKFVPPPPKQEEVIPDLKSLIESRIEYKMLEGLITESADWAQQEREAKKARRPITEKIKQVLGKHGVSRAMCGEYRVIYYNAPRTSISKELLLSAGVDPEVIEECTISKDAYTLRILEPGEKEWGADD